MIYNRLFGCRWSVRLQSNPFFCGIQGSAGASPSLGWGNRAFGVLPACVSRLTIGLLFMLICNSVAVHGQTTEPTYTVIFSTGFEQEEGYEAGFQLSGQNGWVSFGSGGNGVVTNFFEGYGQQGFIGFNSPAPKDAFLNVWNPIHRLPAGSNEPIVRFYVLMQIVDSTNGEYDDFRWSVYNAGAHRLFSIDFDNSSLEISYLLDDGVEFIPTGLAYDNDGFYDLLVTMDFARNRWSALINDIPLVRSEPITTTGAALNLGDINAVWAIRKLGSPGDNFILFDNFEIVASSRGALRARLEPLGFFEGVSQLRLFGEEGINYLVEWSANLNDWTPLTKVLAPIGGVVEFGDAEANPLSQRFYRVRQNW